MGEIVEDMKDARSVDAMLEAFKKLVSYMRGSLWWVRNDLLKARQSTFNQYDQHKGHPALSLRLCPVESRLDAVPMLMGTSGDGLTRQTRKECVEVTGMTTKDPDHKTYFGSIVEPGLYVAEELLDGVAKKDDVVEGRDRGGNKTLVLKPWHECRVMVPNWDKPMVDATEMTALNGFCSKHGL